MKHGPENQGNDCYLNVLVSVLLFCPHWVRVVKKHHKHEWHEIVRRTWFDLDRDPREAIRLWKASLPLGILRSNVQEDSHEALLSLFETYPRTLAPLFETRVLNAYQCSCGYTFTRDEVQYSYPDHRPTHLIPEYRCDLCNDVNTTTKSQTVSKEPLIALITVHRNKGARLKDKTLTSIESTKTIGGKSYTHTASILHRGSSTDYGHYVCEVAFDTHRWYAVDDSEIRALDQGPTEVSRDVCMIFYSLVNPHT